MKKTILFASTIAIALVSTLFSCVESDKNLYDASFKMPNPMGEGFSAPDGFDWSTMNNVQATVEVNDEHQGQYYYKVEIYDKNPIISNDAHLLYSGVAKEGEPCITNITLEKASNTIYIKEYTPTGLFTVRAAEVTAEGTAKCSFKSVASTTRGLATTRAFVNFQDPDNNDTSVFPQKCPKNLTEFKGQDAIVAGGSYEVTSSTKTINLGSIFNIKLYVTENITLDSELYLSQGSSLYILPGVNVTMPVCKNNGQSNCLISIGSKATLTIKGDTQIDSNYKLYNLGTFNTKNLSCTNSSVFYNAGNAYIENKLSGENSGSTIVNVAELKAEDIYLQGNSHMINRDTGKVEVENESILNCTGGSWENDGKWITDEMSVSANNDYCYNKCQLVVKDELELNGGHLIVDAGGYVECQELGMKNNAKVDLGAKSLFKVTEEATYGYNIKDRGFKGTGAEKGLIVIKKVIAEFPNNADIIHYTGNLQIICSDHPEADLGWGKRWTMTNGAEWAEEGSNTISIPKTECNEGYNGGTPTPPVDPSFPIIVDDKKDYAYMYEDQWPLYGDYDLNDIVMVINKRKLSVNKNNLVEKFELSIDLCAVGATKKLGAAIMLDGVKASDIKSPVEFEDNNIINSFNLNEMKIEKGQDLAVIPLFDDAHIALGRPRYEAINTSQGSQNNTKNKTINLTIEFSTPTLSADAFNINKLNLFIFNNLNRDVRREVHVIGFQPTKLAETDIFGNNNDNSSFSNKKYYISKENLAWGIMVPTNFKWPLEYVNIKNAYPEFESWVTSGGKENDKWWNGFNVDKVFQTNKN